MLNGILKHYPKKETPSSWKEERESEPHELWSVSFFLIHALISSLVCYCCDCFLGLFVELLVTHLSFLKCIRVWRFAVLIYSIFFVCLALSPCSLAHPFIRWLALNLFCAHGISVVIEFIFHLLFRRHNIRSVVLFIHARLWAHTHSPFETSQRREEKKTYDEQFFVRTIQITISLLWC